MLHAFSTAGCFDDHEIQINVLVGTVKGMRWESAEWVVSFCTLSYFGDILKITCLFQSVFSLLVTGYFVLQPCVSQSKLDNVSFQHSP